jgi:hypothetical protein
MLVVYSALQIFCINQLSVNYDEGSFASYGVTILKFQREKDVIRYESKLPITALNMIPRAIEQIFKPGLKKQYDAAQSDIIRGRYISLFVSVLLGLVIFKWSKKLYNSRTALFSLLFYLLCPNFLAHGIFTSSDIFACFFMTLSLYYLWRFCLEQKTRFFIFMSVATALAEISKFSMFHLFIIIPLLLVIVRLRLKKDNGSQQYFSAKKILSYTVLFICINWLIICAAHFFYQVFLPMKDYEFMSSSFKNLQHLLPWLPIPLPSSYISSMDAVMYFDQLGGGVKGSLNGPIYILGESSNKGFWYYYFVTLFLKLPIPVLIVWLGSMFLFFRNFNRSNFFRNEIFLLLPAFYFLIYMNFFYSTQVGIRHILIIFPLLYIFSGRFISKLFEWKKQFILYLLIAWQAVSVFNYFPHFLPYTNEFIWNKKMAYKKIADSNLCYGEGRKFLEKYLVKNKDAIVLPEKPVAGKIVMEVNEMLNKDIRTMGKYDWVNKLTPVDHIHSQYLVFDVKQSFIDSMNNK